MYAQLDLTQVAFFNKVFNTMFLCSLSYSYTRWGVKRLFIRIDFDVSLEVLKVECLLK